MMVKWIECLPPQRFEIRFPTVPITLMIDSSSISLGSLPHLWVILYYSEFHTPSFTVLWGVVALRCFFSNASKPHPCNKKATVSYRATRLSCSRTIIRARFCPPKNDYVTNPTILCTIIKMTKQANGVYFKKRPPLLKFYRLSVLDITI